MTTDTDDFTLYRQGGVLEHVELCRTELASGALRIFEAHILERGGIMFVIYSIAPNRRSVVNITIPASRTRDIRVALDRLDELARTACCARPRHGARLPAHAPVDEPAARPHVARAPTPGKRSAP